MKAILSVILNVSVICMKGVVGIGILIPGGVWGVERKKFPRLVISLSLAITPLQHTFNFYPATVWFQMTPSDLKWSTWQNFQRYGASRGLWATAGMIFNQYLSLSRKRYNIWQLQWKTNRNSYAICRTVPSSISRTRHYSTLNISETVQDRDMVTMDYW